MKEEDLTDTQNAALTRDKETIARASLQWISTAMILLLTCAQPVVHNAQRSLHAQSGKTQTTHPPITAKTNGSRMDQQNAWAAFIPHGYALLDTASGDLNQDGISDMLLVLKVAGEDSLSIEDSILRRPLLILLRDQHQELQLAQRNDNAVYCYTCGGVMGDPFVGVTIEGGKFTLSHYGGSAWRWTREITFYYSRKAAGWYLYADASSSFHVADPEAVERKTRSKRQVGKVAFRDFDIYREV